MSKSTILIIVALVLTLIGTALYYNSMVGMKNGLEAQLRTNQTNYSKVEKVLKGSGLVAQTASKDQTDNLIKAISARYGDGGSKAAMQWIQEQNPQLDISALKTLQTQIETEYAQFDALQRTLINKVRIFKNKVEGFPGFVLAPLMGIDSDTIKKYNVVLISEAAQADFGSGTMSDFDLLGDKKEN